MFCASSTERMSLKVPL